MSRNRQEIGPYRVLRLIRRGGEGSVYLAHDSRLNRRVALKLISMPADQQGREQALFEARSLARISHNSVVQIFDVVESRRYLALVMEYVPGTDLEVLLEHADFDLSATLLLATALCTSLGIAHREGIIHRDLKAANILLDGNGKVKLGDFGIALGSPEKQSGDVTQTDLASGSYLSMSPEQASGAALDQRCDLFALGLLLYRLLAGRHPFANAESELVLLQNLVHRPHRSLVGQAGVPPALADLVDELLQKEPARRPVSAVAVRHRLMDIIRSLPIIRGDPLRRLVRGRGRETDAMGIGVELPPGVDDGVHSHVFPFHKWGLGQLRRDSLLVMAKSLLVILPLGLLLGMTAKQWPRVEPVWVEVRPPMALALEEHSHMREQALHAMLLSAVSQREYLSMRPGRPSASASAQLLVLQVQCNRYICGLQMTRGSGEEMQMDFRSLPPDATAGAWEVSIDRSVGLLFSDG